MRSTAATPGAIAEPVASTAVAFETATEITREGNGSTTPHTPTYEEIAEAAYRRYLERGGQHGYDFDDWLDAERSLRER